MLHIHSLDTKFQTIADVFSASLETDELGAGFAAYIGDKCIINITGGYADRAKTKPFTEKTLVPVYSTTKGIAALILGQAVQSLENGYNTKVSDIWPEYGTHGKEETTIGHVASHQAGLPGFLDEIDPELWLKPKALADALADTAPLWPPGTAHGYHPLSWGYLVQEIVTRITGKSVGTLLAEISNSDFADGTNERIDFWIGLPKSEHKRVSQMLRPKRLPELSEITPPKRAAFLTPWAAPNRGGAIWAEIEIPSANGHGTAKSVAQLYSAWAQDGFLPGIGGRKILISAAMRQTYASGPDLVLNANTEFAAGIMRNNSEKYGPNHNSFGHSGWGGSMALADPDLGLSCAYVMNKQSHYLQGDPRAQRLVNALYDAI